MKNQLKLVACAFVCALLLTSLAFSQASAIPASRLITPEDLVKILKSPHEKPVIIQVGSRVLFQEAHTPGSEYLGPAASDAGIIQLKRRLESVPRGREIVIYCGCCPWGHCPNVKPADDALQAMGFKNVKVLYLANNFGADWVDRGYPTAKGE